MRTTRHPLTLSIVLAIVLATVQFVHADSGFAPQIRLVGGEVHRAEATDVDRDGDLDFIAADDVSTSSVRFWENLDGKGTEWANHEIGTHLGRDIALLDIDRDGDVDVIHAVLNTQKDGVSLYAFINDRSGGGAWSSALILDHGWDWIQSLGVGDIDGDGYGDIVLSDDDDIEWLNFDGKDWIRHTLEPGYPNVRVDDPVDLDGDGDLDVIGWTDDGPVYWYENDIGKNFGWWTRHAIPGFNNVEGRVAVGDLDRDGDLDLIAGRPTPDDFFCEPNWAENTAGDASAWTIHVINPLTNGAFPFDSTDFMCVADLDHDGDFDLSVGSFNECVIGWLENLGDAASWRQHLVGEVEEPTFTFVADVNGDSYGDLVSGSREGDGLAWWRNVVPRPTIQFPDDPPLVPIRNPAFSGISESALAHADVDGDGDLDVLTTGRSDDDIDWEENPGPGGSAWINHTISGNFDLPRDVLAADIDGDGDEDVLALSSSDLPIWINDGTGGFPGPQSGVSLNAIGATNMAAGDIDRDGDIDLVVAFPDCFLWYENLDGLGTTWSTLQTISDIADGADHPVLADMDNDGDLDLVGIAVINERVEWHENIEDGAVWLAHTIANDVANLGTVKVADIDRDGRMDVITATDLDVVWWKNLGGVAAWSENFVASLRGTNATAVAGADLDNDGDMDLIFYDGQQLRVAWQLESAGGPAWLIGETIAEITELIDLEIADLDGNGLPEPYASAYLYSDTKEPDLVLGYWSADRIPAQILPPDLLSIRRLGDQVELTWRSTPGCRYWVEYSVGLVQWTRYLVFHADDTTTSGLFSPPPVAQNRAFFRIVEQ